MKYFQSKQTWLLYVLAIISVANLYANYAMHSSLEVGITLELVTKPLLMPLLIVYFYVNTKSQTHFLSKWILLALVLAWLGDILLLFQSYHSLLFALGLGSFLISHIYYSIAFRKSMQGEPLGETKSLIVRAIPFIGTAVLMFIFLFQWLDTAMKIAVPLYIFVIMSMAFLAMERAGKVLKASAEIVFYGAFCFLVSDAILAIDKFAYRSVAIPYASVWIMATYIAAQFLIVWGMLIQIKSKL